MQEKRLAIKRAEELDVPILTEGVLVCVLPSDEYLNSGVKGIASPFWIGRIEVDEVVPTSMQLQRAPVYMHYGVCDDTLQAHEAALNVPYF